VAPICHYTGIVSRCHARLGDYLDNKPTIYDRLSELSEGLIALASLLGLSAKEGKFDQVSPRMTYVIHAIRTKEYYLREKVFTSLKADVVFNEVDKALSDAEYVMSITDADEDPNTSNLESISELVRDAAASVKKMAVEGRASNGVPKGTQQSLNEEKPRVTPPSGSDNQTRTTDSVVEKVQDWLSRLSARLLK